MAADEVISGVDPKTYGNNSNLWGLSSLTGADIIDDEFGFAFAAGQNVSGVKTTKTSYILGMNFPFAAAPAADISGFAVTFDTYGYSSGGGTTTLGLDSIKATAYFTWRPTVTGTGRASGGVYIEPIHKKNIQKRFAYDITSHQGDYLGRWQDVASEPNFKRDVNNLLATMDVQFARNEKIKPVAVDLLGTEADEQVVTEDDVSLGFDTTTPTGLGSGTDLDLNHDVDVKAFYGQWLALCTEDDEPLITEDGETLMVGDGAPDGRSIYTGYIARWLLDYGTSDDVKASLMSHSNEQKILCFVVMKPCSSITTGTAATTLA
jgi:hypothetical protein